MSGADDQLDREAVTAFLASRSEPAFRVLYHRHAPSLYGLLLRLTGGNAALAQDLMQEAWLRAVAGLDRFAWQSKLGTWLHGIGVNCWREWLRDTRRDALMLADESPDQIEADLPASVDGVALAQAVDSLPEGYRTVLVLHDIEGYAHDEIAALLGIAPGTSKSQLSRARTALKRSLR
ncbi:MAG TPA: RNA polymerase sigma factor [Gemmatimonadales bacterium]